VLLYDFHIEYHSKGAMLEIVYSVVIAQKNWYLRHGFYITYWLSFFRFFLLCYQFIPVSLYVTLSLVYTMQAIFMQNDLKL